MWPGSSIPPGSSINWSIVGAPADWTLDTPSDPATVICAADPVITSPVTLMLEVTSPEGCLDTQEFSLSVLPASAAADLGNALVATKLASGEAQLRWVDIGATNYDAYVVIDKALIPGMMTPADLLGSTASTSIDETTPRIKAFYKVQGACP